MTGPINLTMMDTEGDAVEHIVILPPGGEPPEYKHTDVDGDRLLIITADINGTPGVYFRTTPNGCSVPLSEMPALLAELQVIMAAAKEI
jgi:hypothetical protein